MIKSKFGRSIANRIFRSQAAEKTMSAVPEKELSLSQKQMRALGYHVVDMLVEHFSSLPHKPVTRKASHAQMEALLKRPIPAQGNDPLQVLAALQNRYFCQYHAPRSPALLRLCAQPSNYVSVMADALAAGSMYSPAPGWKPPARL